MPLYAYRCSACGHVFDAIRRLSDAATPAECPSCGKIAGERQLAAPARYGGGHGGGGSPHSCGSSGFT